MSTLLVSCGNVKKDKDDKPGKGEVTPEEAQAIADGISSFNLGALLEGLGDVSVPEMSDLLGSLEFEATMSVDSIEMSESLMGYIGLKDGIFKSSSNGDESYLIIQGNNMLSVAPYYEGGYSLALESVGGEEIDISQYLSDDVINILKEFRFPTIKANQITKDGDTYMVSDSYIESVAKEIIDTALELAVEAGLPQSALPTDDDYDELVETVNKLLGAMGIKIGFKLSNNTVNGIVFEFECSADSIADAFGVISGDDDTVIAGKLSIEYMPETLALTHFEASIAVSQYGEDTSMDCVLDISYSNDNMPIRLDASFNVTGPDSTYDYIEHNNQYVELELTGSMTANISASVDLTKLDGTKSGKLMDASVSYSSVYNTLVAYTYDEYNGYCEVDPSDIGLAVNLKDYSENNAMTLQADTVNENKINFSITVEENGTSQSVTGTAEYNLENAYNYGAVPAFVRTMNSSYFIETLKELEYTAEHVLYQLEETEAMDSYLLYDAETGLYLYFDGYFDYTILTEAPNDGYYTQIYVDSYGNITK